VKLQIHSHHTLTETQQLEGDATMALGEKKRTKKKRTVDKSASPSAVAKAFALSQAGLVKDAVECCSATLIPLAAARMAALGTTGIVLGILREGCQTIETRFVPQDEIRKVVTGKTVTRTSRLGLGANARTVVFVPRFEFANGTVICASATALSAVFAHAVRPQPPLYHVDNSEL
jgi:hypothetical protein